MDVPLRFGLEFPSSTLPGMPNPPAGGFWSGLGDILATPGVVPTLAGALGWVQQPAAPGGLASAAASGAEAAFGGDPSVFFDVSPAGLRAKRQIVVENPMSGRLHYFVNRGRPVLYSGDLAAKRRVERVARRVGGGRRRRAAPSGPTLVHEVPATATLKVA